MRGKKCIPGLFCVENMTLFIVFVLLIVLTYMYYIMVVKPYSAQQSHHTQPHNSISGSISSSQYASTQPIVMVVSAPPLANVSADPIQRTGWTGPLPPSEGPATIRERERIQMGIHPPVPSRGYPTTYSPIGVLTRLTGSGDMILPLMGRPSANGRGQYQYYTMTTSGNLNTKLPVSVNGKSCTSEYGCGEISNGDIVYVEGYNDTFRATIYENGLFSYNPMV